MNRYFVTDETLEWVLGLHATQTHNLSLVVLSCMIALFVAYTATHLAARIHTAPDRHHKAVWLAAAATSLGGGIWSMHFLAALATAPMPEVHYDGGMILKSGLLMAAASGCACLIMVVSRMTWPGTILSGAILACGTLAVHHMSMAAINPDVMLRYKAGSLAAAAVVTLALSGLALRMICLAGEQAKRQIPLRRLIGAVTIGASLVFVHLMAMNSIVIVPLPFVHGSGHTLHVDQIGPIVAVVIMLANGIALVAALMEHRVLATTDDAAQRLRLILDSLPLGIAYLDNELRFQFVNRTFMDIYLKHSDATRIIGQRLGDVAPPAAVEQVLSFYRQALQGQRTEFLASARIRSDRQILRNVSLVPETDPDGKVRGVFVVAQDVTEQHRSQTKLRESEQRLQSLLEHVPAAVFLKDQQARYQLVNRQFEDWFGLSNERAFGRTVHELYPPERAERYWKGDREILSSGAVTTDELQIPTVNGGLRTFTLTKYPIVDHGVHAGYGGIIVDVTERAEAEAASRQSERQAALANRAKSEFLANMSHELRTPLNAILGFAEILGTQMLGPFGNEKYVEYANDIHTSADHLLGLINDILDLSKIESGADQLMEEDIRLDEVVEAVLTLVKGRAADSRIGIVSDVPADLPALCADKRKLKQILVNLLTNAVKFTAAGGTVAVRARLEAGHGIVVDVQDTGIGMAPEDIPRALAPFGQLDSALSRRFEGTGLGLPLTVQLVEMHGGTLEILSAVGQGTTARIRFPADRIVPASEDGRGQDQIRSAIAS